MSEKSTTLKQRAASRTRMAGWLWWSWVTASATVYVLREHLDLISTEVARVWLIVLLVVAWCGIGLLYRFRSNDCNVCEFPDIRSDWKHCPGCGIPTDLTDSERKNALRSRVALSIEDLYFANHVDTTRKRAKRWRFANVSSLVIFFVFVFGTMPLYFVGPNVGFFVANWHWFVIGGMVPFLAVQLANAVRGLRCVACNKRLGNEAQGFTIASSNPSQQRWSYCPHCAHPIDLPRSPTAARS